MGNWAVLPMAFAGIIVFLIFAPVLDQIINMVFTVLDASGANPHTALIKIALGAIPLIIILKFGGDLINGFRSDENIQREW